jgi:SAM-dependent methyltransferase
VTAAEASEFLHPAVPAGPGTWADLGAGEGTFTRALAALLGAGGRVVAVDSDAAAVAALERLAREEGLGARIIPVRADLLRLPDLPELAGGVDGVLFGSVLHFLEDAGAALRGAAGLLRPGGRIVVIEYDGAPASPWVPYPLPADRLPVLAAAAGLGHPEVVARRPSRYRGVLYCAVLPL